MSLGTTCYVHVLSETSPCMSPLEIGNNFIGVNKGGHTLSELSACLVRHITGVTVMGTCLRPYIVRNIGMPCKTHYGCHSDGHLSASIHCQKHRHAL